MAGFVESPNTVRILLHWTLHGRPQLNVLHGNFPGTGPLNPASPQNIFNAAVTALTSTGYVSVLSTTTSFVSVGMVDLRFAGVPEVLSTGTAVPGTGAAPALPDQVSLVLTLRTAKTGRSHRGRIYTLGWGTDRVQGSGLSDQTAATSARAFYLAVRTAMGNEGMPLAIRSPALPVRPAKPTGTLPAKPYEITQVTDIVIRDLIFDTNRRRTDLLRR